MISPIVRTKKSPLRLVDHLNAGELDLRRIEYLVLDEADRLLERCFAESLGKILGSLPQKRHTLLFSATMTSSLQKLEKMAMKDTFRFDVTSKYVPPLFIIGKPYFLFFNIKIRPCSDFAAAVFIYAQHDQGSLFLLFLILESN